MHSIVMLQKLHNPTEKENVSSFKVLYKRRHLKMYILFLLPSVLIIVIIILFLIIVKMIVEWAHFFKDLAIVLYICSIPFT